jgi:hypothetical protein
VEAVLHNLCGYHLSERDPLLRYEALTREQVLYDALVSAIRRERGRAVAEIVAAGHKINHVAEMTRLGTRQRVQRLITIAKAAEEAAGEAAVVAAAAAAEVEVVRGLGAAVISTVQGLAAAGYGDEEYAVTAAEPEAAYQVPAYGASGYEAGPEAGPEAAEYEPSAYPGPGYGTAAGYEGGGYGGGFEGGRYEGGGGYDGEAPGYGSLPVPQQRADRSRFDSEVIPEYDADPHFAGAHDDDDLDPHAVLEPTMMMPTIVEPTREVKPAGDPSWWRRGRDSTARSA